MKSRLPMLLTAAAILLTACDAMDWAGEMMEKQNAIQAELQSRHGLSTQVGWHISNGILTTVDVRFSVSEVEGRAVSELRQIAVPVILKYFDQTPETLVLCVDLGDVAAH